MHFKTKYNSFLLILFFLILHSCKTIEIKEEENVFSEKISIKTLSRPLPDQKGIISYANYQIFIANGNETIEEVAIRLKIIPEELALYNGLIINYRPRDGEVLALPKRIDTSEIKIFKDWSEESTRETIKTEVGIEVDKLSDPNDPLRHRIKPGETAYSIANLYNVSVKSLANWNGLGPDLNLRVGREIIIPAAAASEDYTQKKKEIEKKYTQQINKIEGSENIVTIKKENENNYKNNTITKKDNPNREVLNEENLTKEENKFIPPVIGIIKNDYNPSPLNGEKRNNGIDYEVNGNSDIKATTDGVIVLISEKAVGSDGKILLMKHEDELISIYGGIGEILVKKGDRVEKSTLIGKAIGKKEQKVIIHFEIRQGMKSIDPKKFLNY